MNLATRPEKIKPAIPEPDPALPQNALYEELIGVLTHDLRSPLGALAVYLDVIESHLDQEELLAKNGQLGELIARARQASMKSQLILNDACELAAIYRGNLAAHSEPVDMEVLIENVATTFKQIYGDGAVDIKRNPDAGSERKTLIDAMRGESVLLRYLEDARMSTSGQPVVIEKTCGGPVCQVILEATPAAPPRQSEEHAVSGQLKGRLGDRKTGAVHYTLSACELIMQAMGGSVSVVRDPHYRAELTFQVLDA